MRVYLVGLIVAVGAAIAYLILDAYDRQVGIIPPILGAHFLDLRIGFLVMALAYMVMSPTSGLFWLAFSNTNEDVAMFSAERLCEDLYVVKFTAILGVGFVASGLTMCLLTICLKWILVGLQQPMTLKHG